MRVSKGARPAATVAAPATARAEPLALVREDQSACVCVRRRGGRELDVGKVGAAELLTFRCRTLAATPRRSARGDVPDPELRFVGDDCERNEFRFVDQNCLTA